MAVTVVVTPGRGYSGSATIVATADGDVAAVIPHGMPAAPQMVVVHGNGAQGAAWLLSGWTVGVIDATNINLVKLNAVGSGNAGVQAVCRWQLPHSVTQ